MSAPSRLHVSKPLLSAVVLVCGLVLLFVWLATRETAAEREINRWLAQLQAGGEPINAQDLARQYPDPPMDEDADLLFAKAFVIASENPSPGSTPLVMSASILPTQAIDDLTFQQLLAFCTATAEITNALPKAVPPGARFAMRWSKGMTNAGAVNFVRVRCLVQFIATHALTAAESGDPERTTVMIEHGFAFVRTVNYEGLLVTHMMRHGCEGLMCTVAERALNRIQFSDAQLQRISRALRRETTNDFRNCLRAEHASAIWAFQAVRAGMPVETLFGGPPNPPWWKRVWNRLRRQRPGYRDADFLAYLQGIPARLHLSTLPPRVAMTEMDRLTRQYTENATSELGYGIMPSSMDRALGNSCRDPGPIGVAGCRPGR